MDLSNYILNKREYYAIHFNDYKNEDLHDYQIKMRLNNDWRQYLREQFYLYEESDDYVYSHYRRWYARERARMLKLCRESGTVLKDMMKERHEAVMEAYEKKGYVLHNCSNILYKRNREKNIKQALERYENKVHEIRTKLRDKYESESGEKRKYTRR